MQTIGLSWQHLYQAFLKELTEKTCKRNKSLKKKQEVLV